MVQNEIKPEAVRLVVWDLDDTFWRGTISEGEIEYLQAHHNIVVELARRGIMSSICSKNDEAPVRARLEQEGSWNYFIFPSISWEAKGERLRRLIADVQLRPQSVLFIDDNPMNLAEAQHYVPGIQVSDETSIADLLERPTCCGKSDPEFSRLKQYQLLQKRKADEASIASTGASNTDFLRASNIRISIDYDVRAHLDRAIELINRTNQLNFTKRRLSEDKEAARASLSKLVARHNRVAGLVRVQDNYGDYGYCGIFVVAQSRARHEYVHFAFSCRILNMGVENWVHAYLNRPRLKVKGEVVSDPTADLGVDWIRRVELGEGGEEVAAEAELDVVRLRGSCDMRPVAHFFGNIAEEVGGELTYVRDGFVVRPDHTLLLAHAARGVDAETLSLAQEIGLTAREFETGMFTDGPGRKLYVLSLKADLRNPVYRHKATGKLFPLSYVGHSRDLLGRPDHAIPESAPHARERLASDYEHVGRTPVADYGANVEAILSKLPADALVVLIRLPEVKLDGGVAKRARDYNRQTAKVAAKYPNVMIKSMTEFVRDPAEMLDPNHFDRQVYFRFFEHLRDLARERLVPSTPDNERAVGDEARKQAA